MASNEVSKSVDAIVAAFATALDVLQKLRQRHSKTTIWSKKTVSKDESQLLRSLEQAPGDIQTEYNNGLRNFGVKFTTGDVYTQNALTRIVLKLNSGLVYIIASFISNKKNMPLLDYTSLANLSDASRAEALYSLGQLQWRLSQQDLNCSEGVRTSVKRFQAQPKPTKGSQSSWSKNGRAVVARVPVKSSSKTQLAIVRPRKGSPASSSSSNTSNTSNASKKCKASSTLTTLPSSCRSIPTPEAPNKSRNVSQETCGKIKPSSGGKTKHSGIASADIVSPGLNTISSHGQNLDSHTHATTPASHLQNSHHTSHDHSMAVHRRQTKLTPSIYTFKSDSTKLGEIPMQRWLEPFDVDAMERVNAWAAAEGWPSSEYYRQMQKRKRPGVLKRMFKRAPSESNAYLVA